MWNEVAMDYFEVLLTIFAVRTEADMKEGRHILAL
jgi:hypothetical protein